jgi:Fe2+ transport system protein B
LITPEVSRNFIRSLTYEQQFLEASLRYEWIRKIVANVTYLNSEVNKLKQVSGKFDTLFLHKIWGVFILFIVLATGMSLLVFFVFACQCMSTLTTVKAETGSWRWSLECFYICL